MTIVVIKNMENMHTLKIDLETSTLENWHGSTLTFCYYKEISATEILAGMRPLDDPCPESPQMVYFVSLVNHHPVDLRIEDVRAQLKLHNEFIPANV